ncbi:MAG TPA: Uma2 family endonuclease [Blastocatellia bacterium]|nr:Uma2 family endonuclease [Blastocatellia bacterium]
MADSTLQFDWVARIKQGLDALFENDETVFVAGDHFWYPVEGRPDIRTAPDAMVIFGRPKGHRRSYRQWREDGIAPQVVFEIWSYSNRPGDKKDKLEFYNRYGVEEFYAHDPRPRKQTMEGWLRQKGRLVKIEEMNGWVSPRLGVTFRRVEDEWNLYHPNGSPFEDYIDLHTAKEEATRIAEAERAAKEAAWAKLRELGIDPEKL